MDHRSATSDPSHRGLKIGQVGMALRGSKEISTCRHVFVALSKVFPRDIVLVATLLYYELITPKVVIRYNTLVIALDDVIVSVRNPHTMKALDASKALAHIQKAPDVSEVLDLSKTPGRTMGVLAPDVSKARECQPPGPNALATTQSESAGVAFLITQFTRKPIAFSFGAGFVIAATSYGYYSKGVNSVGELGLCHYYPTAELHYSGVEGQIISVACGQSHTLMMRYSGAGRVKVSGWGSNGNYQLGFDDNRHHKSCVAYPIELSGVMGIRAIACGSAYSMILAKTSVYISGPYGFDNLDVAGAVGMCALHHFPIVLAGAYSYVCGQDQPKPTRPHSQDRCTKTMDWARRLIAKIDPYSLRGCVLAISGNASVAAVTTSRGIYLLRNESNGHMQEIVPLW